MLKQINFFNPWYKNNGYKLKEEKLLKRFAFDNLKLFLEKQLIVSIVGLRRTGKTTILKQLISKLLLTSFKPKNIFFYTFSSIDNDLKSVLDCYFDKILQTTVQKAEKTYLFLDELQYSENWQEQLKLIYDANPKIHIFISGSSSLDLHKQTKESLAGRLIDFYLEPLGFKEYLFLKYKKKFNKVDFSNLHFTDCKKLEAQTSLYQDDFEIYLNQGEFPQLVNEKKREVVRLYLKNAILDKILGGDIQLFEVNKLKEFRLLYKTLAQQTGQMINKSNISRDLQINLATVNRYLAIQEKAFLIKTTDNYLRSIRSREKSFKKVFLTSVNLALQMLEIEDFNSLPFEDYKGHLFETYVFNQVQRTCSKNVFFYFKNQKEIDIVIESGADKIPIEVKFKDNLKRTDLNHLIAFAKKHNSKYGILVYKGALEKIKRQGVIVYLLPYYLV